MSNLKSECNLQKSKLIYIGQIHEITESHVQKQLKIDINYIE